MKKLTKQERKDKAWEEYRKKCEEIDNESEEKCKTCGRELE